MFLLNFFADVSDKDKTFVKKKYLNKKCIPANFSVSFKPRQTKNVIEVFF